MASFSLSDWQAAFRGRRHDLVRKPDAGNPHVRFDERGLETVVTGAGLRPGAKTTDKPSDPKAGAPALDSTEPLGGERLVQQGHRGLGIIGSGRPRYPLRGARRRSPRGFRTQAWRSGKGRGVSSPSWPRPHPLGVQVRLAARARGLGRNAELGITSQAFGVVACDSFFTKPSRLGVKPDMTVAFRTALPYILLHDYSLQSSPGAASAA